MNKNKNIQKQFLVIENKKKKKQGSTRSRTTSVVVAAPSSVRTSVARVNLAVNRTGRKMAGAGYERLYLKAVLNPFIESSRGIKNPDGFCFPTETRAIKCRANILANASNSAVCVNPSLLYGLIDISQINTGTACMNPTGFVPASSNTYLYAPTTVTALGAAYETFRVVAGGVKVRVQTPLLTRTGNLVCAPYIVAPTQPGYGLTYFSTMLTTGVGTDVVSTFLGGIQSLQAGSANILEMPGAFEISLSEMGNEDLILPFRPISNIAASFHSTTTSTVYSAVSSFGTQILDTSATGVVVNTDEGDLHSAAGFCGWLLFLDGYPISSGTPLVSLEFIYHLEGVPTIAASGGFVPVPDSDRTPPVHESMYRQVLRSLSNMDWEELVSTGGETIGIASRMATATMGSRRGGQRLLRQY